jgi:hypothetical protein
VLSFVQNAELNFEKSENPMIYDNPGADANALQKSEQEKHG